MYFVKQEMGFPGGMVAKRRPANAGRHKRPGFNPWVRKTCWSRKRQLHQYGCLEIPWKEEPAGYSPWSCKESYMTERTPTQAGNTYVRTKYFLGHFTSQNIIQFPLFKTIICESI